MPKCSNILEFNLFADDTNLFLDSPNILNLETNLNVELGKEASGYMLTNYLWTLKKPALWYSILHKKE